MPTTTEQHTLKELRASLSMLESGNVFAAKTLLCSVANHMADHYCDRCGDYSKARLIRCELTVRDYCRGCAYELGIREPLDEEDYRR